jgi:hypothetical protein
MLSRLAPEASGGMGETPHTQPPNPFFGASSRHRP